MLRLAVMNTRAIAALPAVRSRIRTVEAVWRVTLTVTAAHTSGAVAVVNVRLPEARAPVTSAAADGADPVGAPLAGSIERPTTFVQASSPSSKWSSTSGGGSTGGAAP